MAVTVPKQVEVRKPSLAKAWTVPDETNAQPTCGGLKVIVGTGVQLSVAEAMAVGTVAKPRLSKITETGVHSRLADFRPPL